MKGLVWCNTVVRGPRFPRDWLREDFSVFICTHSFISSIQQALTTQIAQKATNTVQQLGQQAGLDVANVTMNNTMAQLMVNVQNIKTVADQADQCQGTVSITLPETDVANANQLAASLNQPTLVQRLNGKGLSLENNTIIAQNMGFKITPNAGNFTATSISADSVINEVSNVLANSQLKQMMVQYSPSTNTTASNSAATTAGVAVGAGAGARNYNRSITTKPQPATQEPKATNIDATKSKSTEIASTQTLTDLSTKTVPKTTTTTTQSTTAAKTATPTNTKTTSIEKSVTTKAVPNDNTKLTIEEKNEKY